MARNVSVTHVTLVMDGDYCHLVGFSPSRPRTVMGHDASPNARISA